MEMFGGRQLEGGGCELAQLGKARDVYLQKARAAESTESSVVTIATRFASQKLKWNASFCQLGKNLDAHRPAVTVHYPNDHHN